MIYTFHYANSHLEMQLNDIIIVSAMVSDANTITDIDPIPKWPTPISVSGISASLLKRYSMMK